VGGRWSELLQFCYFLSLYIPVKPVIVRLIQVFRQKISMPGHMLKAGKTYPDNSGKGKDPAVCPVGKIILYHYYNKYLSFTLLFTIKLQFSVTRMPVYVPWRFLSFKDSALRF